MIHQDKNPIKLNLHNLEYSEDEAPSLKNTINLLYTKFLCKVFNKHDWSIVSSLENFDHFIIRSSDDYRSKVANHLECNCCGIKNHITDIQLNAYDLTCYRWQTDILWEYYA